jgi:hypothetical protein
MHLLLYYAGASVVWLLKQELNGFEHSKLVFSACGGF